MTSNSKWYRDSDRSKSRFEVPSCKAYEPLEEHVPLYRLCDVEPEFVGLRTTIGVMPQNYVADPSNHADRISWIHSGQRDVVKFSCVRIVRKENCWKFIGRYMTLINNLSGKFYSVVGRVYLLIQGISAVTIRYQHMPRVANVIVKSPFLTKYRRCHAFIITTIKIDRDQCAVRFKFADLIFAANCIHLTIAPTIFQQFSHSVRWRQVPSSGADV